MNGAGTGNPHADTEGGDQITQTHTPTTPTHYTISIEDYLKRPAPEKAKHLVEGLVPAAGRIVVIGPAKHGKTTLALQLMDCLGSGRRFLGREVAKGRSLFLQLDTPEELWRALIERGLEEGLHYKDARILDPSNTPNLVTFDLRELKWQAWLRSVIAEVDPALVVFDVLRKLHKANENDSAEMTEVNNTLADLTKGRGTVILHHPAKFNDDDGVPLVAHAGRGSTVIAGDADGTWLLYRGVLKTESRLDEDLTFHLQRTPNGFWVTSVEVHADELAKVKALQDANPSLSENQLAKLAGTMWKMSRSTLQRRLAMLRGGPTPTGSGPVGQPTEDPK